MPAARNAKDAGARDDVSADKRLVLKGAEERQANPGQSSGLPCGAAYWLDVPNPVLRE